MSTATVTPPPLSNAVPATSLADSSTPPAALILQPTPKPTAATGERPLRRDWIALVFWFSCFVFMGMMHLIDLIASLFR